MKKQNNTKDYIEIKVTKSTLNNLMNGAKKEGVSVDEFIVNIINNYERGKGQ